MGLVLVRGHVLNTRRCIFKESPKATERIYLPADLAAYGVENEKYFYAADISTGNTGHEMVFLECIVRGKASLFFYSSRYFIRMNGNLEELVQTKEEVKRDEKVYTIKHPIYKSVLQKEMGDCPKAIETIMTTDLTQKSLTRLFVSYQECVGNTATVYASSDPDGIGIRLGFSGGILSSDLVFKSNNQGRYIFADGGSLDQTVTFTPSLLVELTYPRLTDKLHLRTGLTYYSTASEIHTKSSSTGLSNDFTLETSQIEIPILLKYTLAGRSLKLSVLGGAGVNNFLKWKNHLVVSTQQGYILNEYDNDLDKKSMFLNFLGGLSLEFSKGGRSFLAEAFYGHTQSIFDDNEFPTGNFNTLKFGLGAFF